MATEQAVMTNPGDAQNAGGMAVPMAAAVTANVQAAAGRVIDATQAATDRAVSTVSGSLDKLNGGKDTGLLAALRATIDSPSTRKVLPLFIVMLVIAVFAGLYGISSKPTNYRPLMPGMGEADQQAAMDALKVASFDAKIDPASGSLSVPADKYHEARIYLASKGIPKQPAPTGIDSLNGDNAMTTSQFMEQVKYIKAMENELAHSITQIGTIQSARVHLALPKQSVFVRDRAQPKASVVVTPFQGRTITAGQVDAIVHLISSSIPYLAPQAVSVVDNVGNLLTNRKENSPMGLTEAQLAHKQTVEDGYRSRIMQILVPVLGEANVRSQVDISLDFTQAESASENFDPNKAGPKTRSEVLAEDRTQKLDAVGVPGSLTNAPPPPTDQTANSNAAGEDSLQNNTTLSKRATRNYEVDKTVRYVKNPMGNVQRVSVAVVVNEKTPDAPVAGAAADSAQTNAGMHGYSQEELDRLTNLVKGVVGFQEERGDVVTLVPARFAPTEDPAGPWYANENIMSNVKLAMAALVFIVILLTIVNPVINFLTGRTLTAEQLAKIHQEQVAIAQVKQQAEEAALAAMQPNLGPNGELLGVDGQPVLGVDGKPLGADGNPLPEPELSAEEMGVIELEEGESLEDIKAKLKPKKSSISLDMLNTANSYDDKVALIRFLVSEDSGRVANVFKTLMRPSGS